MKLASSSKNRSSQTPGHRLELDLTGPTTRSYSASEHRRPHTPDLRKISNACTWIGTFASVALLGYVFVFTSPDHTENVLAFLALTGFTAFFAASAVGMWIRTSDDDSAIPPSRTTVSRQALLIAVGAMAVSVAAINGVVSPASTILTVLVIVSAELVLRRMRFTR